MRHCNQGWFREQFGFLKQQFLQDGEQRFACALSDELVKQALDVIDFEWKDRIYTPLVTLWLFLSQVISADHSCRAAVARFVVQRVAQGHASCSSRTGAYCQARKKLPEEFFSTIARGVGKKLERQSRDNWLWKGHRVLMFDGTTAVMPDTKGNRAAYPPTPSSRPGVGMPLARVGAVFSLTCGVVLDLATAKYAGKGQGEVTLLRQLSHVFSKGNVLLADSLMCNWRNLFEFQERGVHVVTRINKAHRKADFRKGKSLGKDDHLVQWPRPTIRSVDRKALSQMPTELTVRETRVHIRQPGFRTKVMVVVTTLLDPVRYSKEDLASLYRQRWNNELDIRSLKTDMQMECLRCKTPELVRKEIWTHVLAYNLTRSLMAEAASKNKILPRTISFKGTLQILEAFQALLSLTPIRTAAVRIEMFKRLIEAVAEHRVADRPNRIEPRRLKRKYNRFDALSIPRDEAKRQILKGLSKN
ncbi:MAG: IS4 family transposase [Planctomycetota bacterium]